MGKVVDYFIIERSSNRIVAIVPTESQGYELMRELRESTDDPKAHISTRFPTQQQLRDFTLGLQDRVIELQDRIERLEERLRAEDHTRRTGQ